MENFDMEEDDENCEIQKPHMQSIAVEEYIKDPMVNTILVFDLHMTNKSVSNNYISEGFGIQRSKDDLLGVSAESIKVFT
jgi:hypothetical protein